MDRPDVEDEEEDETPESKPVKERRRKSPHPEQKILDPYASEDASSMIFPIIIAVAAFVPLVFCLCRL